MVDSNSVIYFYPADDISVCTQGACAFRDHFQDFTDTGTVQSHKAFQQKYLLPFTLLSDPGNKVLDMFGVRNFLFLTGRETFLVNEKGIALYKYTSMLQGTKHVRNVLQFLHS